MKTYNKQDKDFAGVSFTTKAARKKGGGNALHHVYQDENGDLVATDGVRLHKYQMLAPLTPGLYHTM